MVDNRHRMGEREELPHMGSTCDGRTPRIAHCFDNYQFPNGKLLFFQIKIHLFTVREIV